MGTFTRRLLALLLLPASLCATTTVTGTLQNLGTGTVGQGAFVRFWLRGCGGNIPRVNGTAVIAPSQGGVYFFDFAANSSGVISGTLYSTRDSTGLLGGDIECGGSKLAVWYGMQVFSAGKGGSEIPVHAKSGSTLDVTQVTPITTNPVITAPTGDSTYLRKDAGNSPLTGNLSSTGTISDTGGTHSGPETFTGPVNCKQLESIQCVDSTFPRGGVDWLDEIGKAYAALPSTGGEIYVSQTGGCQNVTTALSFSVAGKTVKLHGAGRPATCFNWTPAAGTPITVDTGNATGFYDTLEDFTLETTNGASTATGISYGPINNLKLAQTNRVDVIGFKVLVLEAGLLNHYVGVNLQGNNGASTSCLKVVTTGDSPRFIGGTIAGCSLLLDNASSNGPINFDSTVFNGPSANGTAFFNLTNEVDCFNCHFVVGAGFPQATYFTLSNAFSQLKLYGGTIEDDRAAGTASQATCSAGGVWMDGVTIEAAGATAAQFWNLSGSCSARFTNNNIASSVYTSIWNTGYAGIVQEMGTTGAPAPVPNSLSTGIQFLQNSANPSSSVASVYNQSGIGPTVSGNAFQVRAGATPADAFDVDASGNTQVKGVLKVAGTLQNTAATATMGLTLKKGSGAGNYTNATTSYTVADSTNLCFTVTIPTGWKLGVSASGGLSTATAAVVAQAALTDNAACSTANAGVLVESPPIQGAGIGVADTFALDWIITGDGAAHNIALQFKTSNVADTASLINSSATITPTMKFELMPSN